MLINNIPNSETLVETIIAIKAIRQQKRRIKVDGIDFVKTNKLFMLLPNNRVSVAPKISRQIPCMTYSGFFQIHGLRDVKDTEHNYSFYLSLAKALEVVKEQLLCEKLTLPSFFDRVTDKGRAGVCFDEKRWVVFKNKYNEDLRNLKVKKEYFKTQAVAEQYAAKIVDQNKEYLLAMMDKHIHLLRTDPNALPLYNEDIHGKIVVLDTTEEENNNELIA